MGYQTSRAGPARAAALVPPSRRTAASRRAQATSPFTEPHVLRLALRVRLAAADRHQHPVAAAAAATSAHRRALTSLRRIPAMKRSPAITASRRPRSTATSSDSSRGLDAADSTPRTRRRGLDAADSTPRTLAGSEDGGQVRRPEGARLAPAALTGGPPVAREDPGRLGWIREIPAGGSTAPPPPPRSRKGGGGQGDGLGLGGGFEDHENIGGGHGHRLQHGARPGTAHFPVVDGCSRVRQGDGLQTRGREIEDQETDRREHGRRLPARPPAAPPIAPPRYVRRSAGRSSGRSRSHVDDAQHGVRPGPALPTRGGLAQSGVLVYASLRARGRCRAVAAAERPEGCLSVDGAWPPDLAADCS